MTDIPPEVKKAIDDLDNQNMKESSKRKAKSNILDYVNWVIDAEGSFPTEGDAVQHVPLVNSYMHYLRNQGYARETIISRWTWVSRLYSELSTPLLNGYAFLDANPFEILENRTDNTRKDYLPEKSEGAQKKKKYYVDKEELELLCDNAPSPAFRTETIYRLGWTSGLRASEVANLKLENVNLEENLLEDFWVPKTLESRSLWIPDKTVWFLEQFLNAGYRSAFSYAEESEYLFPTNQSEHVQAHWVTQLVSQGAENAGIQETLYTDQSGGQRKKVTAHAMRRGHGMYLWKQGKSLPEIQQRLGHKQSSQTDEYLPISTEESKKQLEDVQF